MTAFPSRRGGLYYLDGIGGRTYVSVTEVLNVLNKPALLTWAARTAAEAIFADPVGVSTVEAAVASIHTKRNKAADRGHDAHAVADAYARAYRESPVEKDRPVLEIGGVDVTKNVYFPAIDGFFRTIQPTVLLSEATLANGTHGYAGTTDLVAEIAGQLFVIDWKTSKGVYPEMRLQLAAYANAERIIGNDFNSAAPMPKIDATAIVLLRQDGTFEWHPFRLEASDFEAFIALKRVWDWKKAQE